jgi:ABC-type sugar transport system ATPase subunit
MNLCSCACDNGAVELGGVRVPVPAGTPHGEIVVGLRPESLDVAPEGIPAEVEVVEEIGADSYVFAAADVGKLVARVETKRAPERGERISLRPRAEEAHLFDPASGARIS